MALLGCYLDDSRDGEEKVVFAVAGFCGWALDFIDRENQWQQCLEKHGLAYFKAAECETVHGEFFRLRHDPSLNSMQKQKSAAAAIRTEFINILNDSKLDGFGLGMSLEDYRRVLATEPGAARILTSKHFYLCYHSLMIELVKWLQRDYKRHFVGFVCDGHKGWQEAEEAYSSLKDRNPNSARIMCSISHEDEKKVIALQMADLLAYEARVATQAKMAGKDIFDRSAFVEIQPSVFTMWVLTEDHLRAIVRELAQLEKDAKK